MGGGGIKTKGFYALCCHFDFKTPDNFFCLGGGGVTTIFYDVLTIAEKIMAKSTPIFLSNSPKRICAKLEIPPLYSPCGPPQSIRDLSPHLTLGWFFTYLFCPQGGSQKGSRRELSIKGAGDGELLRPLRRSCTPANIPGFSTNNITREVSADLIICVC